MSTARFLNIEAYIPKAGEKFYFDTNIWMYLYCPVGNYKREIIGKYDHFLKKIIKERSVILISSLVLSEIFNAYLKLEFSILKEKNPQKYRNYKMDFRKKEIYKKKALEVKGIVQKQILTLAERIDDGFSKLDLDDLFEEIEVSDFNDKYHLMLAAKEEHKIVTDDGDFAILSKIPIPIITANRKILSRSRKN